MNITVIGMGYVGLPLAVKLCFAGHKVIGVDKNRQKIKLLQKKILPFAQNEPHLPKFFKIASQSKKLSFTSQYDSISSSGLIFVNVDTPLNGKSPDNTSLISACQSTAKFLKKDSIVIIESTVAPKTCENLIGPILENESGLNLNTDFYLAHVPERIRPNHIFEQLTHLQRIIGVSTPKIKPTLKKIYSQITSGELDFTDLTTAEVTKTAENTFRDVNIALANQIAVACEELGVDFWSVRSFINKAPLYNLLQSGAGVGGHCIPKDPWLLYSSLKRTKLDLIKSARKINDEMPNHVLDLLKTAIFQKNLMLEKIKVAILGYSYVEDSDDTRNSPTQKFVELLAKKNIDYKIHDPFVGQYKKIDKYRVLTKTDALVILVKHSDYKKLNLSRIAKLMRTKIIIDGRNFIDKNKAVAAGFLYKGVGNV